MEAVAALAPGLLGQPAQHRARVPAPARVRMGGEIVHVQRALAPAHEVHDAEAGHGDRVVGPVHERADQAIALGPLHVVDAGHERGAVCVLRP